jgi:erythromycin esterase
MTLMCPGVAEAQRPLNLDFERVSVADSSKPWGWSPGWSAFAAQSSATFSLDSIGCHGGRRCLAISQKAAGAPDQPQALSLQVAAAFARGHDLRLTAWTRTAGFQGRVVLSLEAWKNQDYAAIDSVALTSTVAAERSRWVRHDLSIKVPTDPTVHSIVITLALAGFGTVWFDDLSLTVDGTPITALPAVAGAPSRQELAWLAGRSTPLRAAGAPGADDSAAADLLAIGRIVGSARLVGLGESTHGTSEFFQEKHRILEYLVRRHGFRVFAIEANQVAVEKINRYVQGGDGTAADVMRAMFAVWNTEEMRDLVEWMRAHNASHAGQMVRFAGYDMQDHTTPIDLIGVYLQTFAPDLHARFLELTAEYRSQPGSATPQVADTTRARWSKQADTLWMLVQGRRTAWLAGVSRAEDSAAVEWAVQYASLIRQAAWFNVELSSPVRDSLMAANLDWVARVLAPDARIVVWAHDVHVSRGGDSLLSFNGGAQMGAFLARAYGYDYRALTFLTREGAYRATRSFTDHAMVAAAAFPAPVGSVEDALHRLARPAGAVGWVVDLRRTKGEADGAWLLTPRPIRHIGYAAYDYGFELTAVLPFEFDGIVFVDHSNPSRAMGH